MTTRSAVIATIALIVLLMGIIAVAAMFAGEVSERSGGIIATVLGGFATVLAGLLLFLRMDTVNSKVDDAAVEAAAARLEAQRAAANAAVAARRGEAVERKINTVSDFVENGGLRENVKKAIHELEDDPDLEERRIERVARGVSKDRHDKANREAGPQARAQMEERVRRRLNEGEGS